MLNFQTPGGVSPFSGLCSHAAQCASQDVRYYIKNLGGRGALFADSVSLMEGGVERKLALALVRSFFALSIGDNILSFSLPCLGSYHWLRTIRLLRLQKTNSSLAPLPLRFAAFSRRSPGRGRARCPTAPRRRGDTPPYLPICQSALKNERLEVNVRMNNSTLQLQLKISNSKSPIPLSNSNSNLQLQLDSPTQTLKHRPRGGPETLSGRIARGRES